VPPIFHAVAVIFAGSLNRHQQRVLELQRLCRALRVLDQKQVPGPDELFRWELTVKRAD
jgi:hypothetical protein